MAQYIFDQSLQVERARLNAMAARWDPGTLRLSEALGLKPGWRVLEVGAGAGSIAEAYAHRVGPTGHVLAIDLDPRFLAAIDLPQVEARKADVLVDPLPEASFDLVHARLVLEHLADYRQALARMKAALRPGGWLLMEDLDWLTAPVSHPHSELHAKVITTVSKFMAAGSGYNPHFGRHLLAELNLLGLENLDSESRGGMMLALPQVGWPPWELLITQFREKLVAMGALSQEEIESWLRLSRDGTTTSMSPLLIAAWGRRPA